MRRQCATRRQRGFSLVELVVVIVLIGAIGGILAMQLGPTIQGYLDVNRRAGLTDQADTALRRIVTDVRAAVPNSLRLHNARCLELVPAIDGGRYRTGPDVSSNRSGDAFLDYDAAATQFDVVTRFTTVPAANDLVVIGNQNPGDVYNRTNVSFIQQVTTRDNPLAADAWMGAHRLSVTPTRIPFGYDGGRFVVVSAAEQAVSYVCENPGLDNATRNGTGRLFRVTRTLVAAAPPARCPQAAGPVLATGVERCEFVLNPNQGATQQSGFIQLQLTLTSGGESVPLTLGAHVSNVP